MPRERTASEDPTPLMEQAPRYVGRSVLRVEDRPLLTGDGAFIDDIDRPGQLYARVVRSETASGWLRSLDVEAARARPDVTMVLTAADLPEQLRIPIRLVPTDAARAALQPFLARERVNYVGEPLAVVVGASPYGVEDAAAEVRAEIEPTPPLTDALDATREDATPVHAAAGGNVVASELITRGDHLNALFERADVVVRERLRVHRHTAHPLEPRGLIAEYDRDAGQLTVWGPTKVKHHNRRVIAGLLELEEARVRFIEPDVGGGFGPRGEIYPEDLLIPWLAIATGKPVKWVEDRQEHFVAVNHSREQVCDFELAATADGKLLGFRARAWIDLGAYMRTNGAVLVLNTATHMPGPYAWEGYAIETLGVVTNKTPAGTYRGPGQYEPALHRERMIDLTARRLGLDPAELRRRNLVPVARMPYDLELTGVAEPIVYDTGDFPLLWERLLERGRYGELRESEPPASRLRGVGTATFVEAGGRGPYEWARVVPGADGSFTVWVGIASLGQGIATALAQIAADALGVPIEKVTVQHNDTAEITEGAGSFSSRGVVFGGNAVVGAIRDLFERARAAGAAALGLDEQEVELIAGGIVRARGQREPAKTFAELGCEGSHRYEKHSRSFSMGGALAVVELDRDTGDVAVRDLVIACDVGRVVNPLLVDGQIVGAAAQGVGGILLEQLAYDEQGQPTVTSFMDYCMPTAAEVPPIDALVLQLPQHDPRTRNGLHVKGAGEAGIVGVGAAVANAVADALGGDAVFTQLPITPGRVMELIDSTREESHK
ncbi:MAG TPA: xanthine dehydrogenase family protein molybdopterin-binding subunit [Conexibacter sp.]|jgi:carbon-monoxide dehydrogenase large subunit